MVCSDSDISKHFEGPLPEIAAMGLMAFDPMWAQETHVNRTGEILHVVSGSVRLVMPDGHVEAGPGDTLLVPSGTPHRDEFDLEEGLEVFYCGFRWPPEERYFRHVKPAAVQRLSLSCKKQLAALFDRLRADLAGPMPVDQLVARSRILTALLLILREVSSPPEETESGGAYGRKRRHELMTQARHYMQQHYCECVSLDEIAAQLHVSGYYLSHVFSAESGFSLFSYLTDIRMEKAGSLLLDGRLNVSQVAPAVGYQSPNYFSKVFRKHYGCSPREFIASHRADA